MKLVKQFDYKTIISMLMGKKVHFTSDCEFFPNFNIVGKVVNYNIRPGELVLKVKIGSRHIDIGSNMRNLRFEIL